MRVRPARALATHASSRCVVRNVYRVPYKLVKLSSISWWILIPFPDRKNIFFITYDKKNIGDIDVFFLNNFFAICDSGKWISETPYTLWSVRGAYNACICRVGCYGQPVTNTRSSITSLTLLVSPSPLFFFLSLTLFSSLSLSSPFCCSLSFCLEFSDVTLTVMELEN